MKFVPAAVAARRAEREGIHAESLVWIEAKNRTTGAAETMGLWTGADHRDFVIDGVSRAYYGAGNILQVPMIQAVVGIEVRRISLVLAATSLEVETAIRGYDVRLAPVQIHRAEFDGNGNLIGDPERIWRGHADGAPISIAGVGGTSTARLDLVSASAILTRYGWATKSDQMQRLRSDDRFRRYATLAANADVYWGEEKASAAEASRSSRGSRPPAEPRSSSDR